ncbi:hypothetical protein SAMN04488128_106363 [Chitinophaga eiseniae]|uniref:Uncharacterized protein n=1 Tax=Chitinophaga eiseniae TaxID=634771 RepID=A0A1T4TVF2_9BACT|nr:hypothetical protein [Chitinophaga eiseniae]SKA44261.1 hypothetical protein SAMN04488128_106363 [Chitinophaga eiseniae]
MHFTFLHPFKLKLHDDHSLVPLHTAPHNTDEGGEFLDDALRMEDLFLPAGGDAPAGATIE